MVDKKTPWCLHPKKAWLVHGRVSVSYLNQQLIQEKPAQHLWDNSWGKQSPCHTEVAEARLQESRPEATHEEDTKVMRNAKSMRNAQNYVG